MIYIICGIIYIVVGIAIFWWLSGSWETEAEYRARKVAFDGTSRVSGGLIAFYAVLWPFAAPVVIIGATCSTVYNFLKSRELNPDSIAERIKTKRG